MVSLGNEIPHQYSRIISNKTSHCGINIFDKNGAFGGTQNLKMVEKAKEIYEYFLKGGTQLLQITSKSN